MQRRDFVKGITVASAFATTAIGQQSAAPPPTAPPQAATMGVTPEAGASTSAQTAMRASLAPILASVPDMVAGTQAHFLSAPQLAALRKLSVTLMPSIDGYPGAAEAGAPEFLDFLIGVSPPSRQHMYQSGLNQLDTEAKKQFGKSFAETSPEQADKVIRPGLVAWITDHPPTDPFERFIALAHRDIRAATMNSHAWSVAAVAAGERAPGEGLYWSPIDPHIEIYV
jgi:Gluconate 2-dehydrogenase subunit 3